MQWFSPDNFRADWYGWAANQLSHAAIGAGSSTFAAMAWLHFWGEYPYQWLLFSTLMVAFTISEVAQKLNRLWDAVEDLTFYAYGATIVCFGFKEQERFQAGLDPNFPLILGVFGVFGIHQIAGIIIRKAQEKRAEEAHRNDLPRTG